MIFLFSSDIYAVFFNCTPVGRASDSIIWPRLKAIYFSRFGQEILVCCLAHQGSTGVFFYFAPDFSKLIGAQGSPSSGSLPNL